MIPIQEICQHQDMLNVKIKSTTKRPLNYRAAIVAELGECLDHLGYKWWKGSPTPDYEAAFMEIVDVLHFALSDVIDKGGIDDEYILEFIEAQREECITRTPKLLDIEELIAAVTDLSEMNGDVALSVTTLYWITLDFGYKSEHLTNWFFGKLALNNLRKEHGYKEDKYIKDWSHCGYKEDNDKLIEIIKNEEIESSNYYAELEKFYITSVK
jgi:hypothetical protein